MALFSMLVGVGQTLAVAAPIFRVLIPVLAIVGVGVFGYYGYKGVAKRDTILLVRRGGGGPVRRTGAVILGALYLGQAVLLTAVLTPVSIGLALG